MLNFAKRSWSRLIFVRLVRRAAGVGLLLAEGFGLRLGFHDVHERAVQLPQHFLQLDLVDLNSKFCKILQNF